MVRLLPRFLATIFLLHLVNPAAPVPAAAQDGEDWNTPRVRELIEQGRQQRQRTGEDSSLEAYRALATGHLYFLIDQEETSERTLVKADQIAVEVYWRAPGEVRQRIVGRRDDERLPTDIRYHLDHLTVVTDEFDDRITVGEGDEVRSVIHPLAPGSSTAYDFRLGDSLTVSFPGPREDVRVYEVEVRPRNPERPGFVGSVFLDRNSAAVVRMTFTFTPASYVDPYLDEIRIALDNGLWDGEHWLPYRQEIEIRRELPYLDIPAGSLIRARYEIGEYDLDPDLPERLFAGPPITARPESELASYPFEEELYARVDEDGLAPTPDLQDVRRRAATMMAERRLRGIGGVRLSTPSISSVARYNRAEGLHVGAGVGYRSGADLTLRLHPGYSFGRGRPSIWSEVTGGRNRPDTGVRLAWNQPRDLGPRRGASGAVNSLAAATLERDYLDPYFVSGLQAFHLFENERLPDIEVRLEVAEHTGGSNVLSDAPGSGIDRPVPTVSEGTNRTVRIGVSNSFGGGWSTRGGVTVGVFEDTGYAEATAGADWSRRSLRDDVEGGASLEGGVVTARAPLQALYRLGGRGTLPGFDYRSFTGDWYWLLEVDGSWGLAAPWLRARAFAAAGATGLTDHSVPENWMSAPSPTPRLAVGLGAGLFWDTLRLDVARGLNDGGWEAFLSVAPSFWPFL